MYGSEDAHVLFRLRSNFAPLHSVCRRDRSSCPFKCMPNLWIASRVHKCLSHDKINDGFSSLIGYTVVLPDSDIFRRQSVTKFRPIKERNDCCLLPIHIRSTPMLAIRSEGLNPAEVAQFLEFVVVQNYLNYVLISLLVYDAGMSIIQDSSSDSLRYLQLQP